MKTALICAAAALFAAPNHHATVLTFDITDLTPAMSVPQDYGDNVKIFTPGTFSYGTAQGTTPDITVAYADTTRFWQSNYGNLNNVIYDSALSTGVLKITLSSAPGFLVGLHSFELAAWAPYFLNDPIIMSVSAFNSLNVPIFSKTNVSVSTTTSTPFTFDTPLIDSSLRIEIDARNLDFQSDGIGIDNITFSQAIVPEPSTTSLLMLTLTSLAAFRGRQRAVTASAMKSADSQQIL
jgi:hypothetical protein